MRGTRIAFSVMSGRLLGKLLRGVGLFLFLFVSIVRLNLGYAGFGPGIE